MAEFKRNFTKSRMNKDLDERLVSNGEYRDARNIEVLASDSSDAGTVQTCLGNSLISDITPGVENGEWNSLGAHQGMSNCVGAIEDDKTNKLYYLIAGPKSPIDTQYPPTPGFAPYVKQRNYCASDMIAEYDTLTGETHPVMVDIHEVTSARCDTCTLVVGVPSPWVPAVGWGAGAFGNEIGVVNTNCLRIGMEVDIFNGTPINPQSIITGTPNNLTRKPIITKIINNQTILISKNIGIPDPSVRGELRMYFRAPRVLNFSTDNGHLRLITGINIVDDMLFWTDNTHEPKKVNITRGKQGSIPPMGVCGICNGHKNTENPYVFNSAPQGGTTHTELIVEKSTIKNISDNDIQLNPDPISGTVWGIEEYVQEKHITVIKRGPLSPLVLEMRSEVKRFDLVTRVLHGIINSCSLDWVGTDPDDAGGPPILPPIGMTSIRWNNIPNVTQISPIADFDIFSDFRVGDVLLLTDNLSADPNTFSGNDVKIKLKVIESNSTDILPTLVRNPLVGNLEVEVLYIDPDVANLGFVTWNVRLEDKAESLYELKFPKFGYRYKYEDGEYSVFSPFSETAFLPQEFKYDPIKGYNTGMTNGLKQLFIKNFIPPNIPLDVVEVEILYKESNSPNIYTLRSFNRTDSEWSIPGTDGYQGFFEVKHDLIHAVVSSNQLLRPWDNVPRRALAQEVTGNRLIYGNYVQNYDIIDTSFPQPINLKPSFQTIVESNTVDKIAFPEQSLKSMRTYQLGVVYKDFYGRETPVLSHPSGVVKVDAAKAAFNNDITMQVETPHPDWAHSFKYFIKEISNEYYNLAMDRWYFADWIPYDGEIKSIWMSFPSEDRNKVDEETTLILKKSNLDATATTSGFISTTPRYKILAVENEAPDFVKTTVESMGILDVVDSGSGGTIGDFFNNAAYPGAPFIGYPQVRITKLAFEKSDFASLQNNHNAVQTGSLFGRGSSLMLRFIRNISGGMITSWYNISNIACVDCKEDITGVAISADAHYVLNIDPSLSDEMEPLVGDGTDPTEIVADIRLEIAKKTIENRPEFDGRFFVKIEADGELKEHLGLEVDVSTSTNLAWINLSTMDAFYLYGAFDAGINSSAMTPPYAVSTWNGAGGQSGQGWAEQMDMSIYVGYYNDQDNSPLEPGYLPPLHRESITIGTHSRSSYYNPYGGAWRHFNDGSLAGGSREFHRGLQYNNHYCGLDNTSEWCYPNENGTPPGQGQYPPPYRILDDWVNLQNNNVPGSTNNAIWFIDSEPAVYMRSRKLASGGNTAPRGFMLEHHGFGADIGEYIIDISIAGIEHQTGCTACEEGVPPSMWAAADAAIHTKLTTDGTRFRFSNDPDGIIYEIYEHEEWDMWNSNSETYSGSHETQFMARRKRYRLTLIEPFTKLNPRYKTIGEPLVVGQFETGSSGSPYQPTNYSDFGGPAGLDNADETTSIQIQFVDPQTSTVQIESKMPENPAIWETEPKEDVGLDIYYEIGGSWPTNMCDGTEKLYIQPGASVEMYKSNPIGTFTTGAWQNRNFLEDGAYDLSSFVVHGAGTPTTIVDQVHVTTTLPATKASWTGHQETRHNVWSGANWENDKIILDSPDPITLPPFPIVPGSNTIDSYDQAPAIPPWVPLSTEITNWERTVDGKILLTVAPPVVVPHATMTSLKPHVGPLYWIHSAPQSVSRNIVPTVVVSIDGCSGLPYPGSFSPYSTKIELNNGQVLNEGDVLLFTNPDGTKVTATVSQDSSWPGTVNLNNVPLTEVYLNAEVHGERQTLSYYNTYSFGNGVESNRVRDLYNAVMLDKGVKASTTLAEQYKEERRKNGLIFSGLYNSKSGVNRLNQFIMAENITKDLNPEYGSIQKLHQRDTDLVTLCEDKVLKVLANKDALFNADDTKNITATQNVLGISIPFVGEYGISKNPESFASEAFRAYFTDKERGAVLRLSRDGLTPISDVGMKDWFADNLPIFDNSFSSGSEDKLVGSYDRRRSLYNVTHRKQECCGPSERLLGTTVSYSETAGGWVSFKDFDAEIAISLNNEYYTGMLGKLWKHHDSTVDRNSFHDWVWDANEDWSVAGRGIITDNAYITLLFNDLPDVIKSFTTLNYEGSQSKVHEYLLNDGGDSIWVNQYYNNQPELGWFCESITTDQQVGTLPGNDLSGEWQGEFLNKEGKWFNYIIGEETRCENTYDCIRPAFPDTCFVTGSTCMDPENVDTREFATQGIGYAGSVRVFGCTDVNSGNYNPSAMNACTGAYVPCVPVGSVMQSGPNCCCEPCVYGCMDSTCSNYNSLATCPCTPMPSCCGNCV